MCELTPESYRVRNIGNVLQTSLAKEPRKRAPDPSVLDAVAKAMKQAARDFFVRTVGVHRVPIEIENGHQSTRPQHADHFSNRPFRVRQMHQDAFGTASIEGA